MRGEQLPEKHLEGLTGLRQFGGSRPLPNQLMRLFR
jgi:hypothetical protein